MEYKDAYQIFSGFVPGAIIDEHEFNKLQTQFKADFLLSKKFFDRVDKHCHSDSLWGDLMKELSDYLLAIQRREEMIDIDSVAKVVGNVPSKVEEIWLSDKSLKTPYNAIESYCELRKKNFTLIAIHVAEFRSLSELFEWARRRARSS
ncbi:hypothetical protein SAMN05444410_1032 [Hydrobacter penzbergensis]|uniref:Uncharacterized protein n=1 Tax=Hydrobacter penzbergensis TaxID=1235997 RepID=A0A8X8IA92_9BACT|nr:hypothetical protein [Hydrobacter penzbergensis]SDW45651.1 hypothetical protein SAMN05444410_1032 [Hydrobacter penzbergensis]